MRRKAADVYTQKLLFVGSRAGTWNTTPQRSSKQIYEHAIIDLQAREDSFMIILTRFL